MEENPKPVRISPKLRKRVGLTLAAFALFGSGLAVGAAIDHHRRPSVIMAPRVATPLQKLANPASFLPAEAVTVTGKVVEKFDGLVVLQDASGKAGMRLGRRGGIANQLAIGATVSVQGFVGPEGLEPTFIVLPDHRVFALRHGHGGRGHRHGDGRR